MTGRRRTFALAFAMAATSGIIGWANHTTGQVSSSTLQAAPARPAPARLSGARAAGGRAASPVSNAGSNSEGSARGMAARQIATLEDERIDESSGLGASRRYPDCLWTHNDSGDTARLFLLTTTGKTVAEVKLENAKAEDWEDMAIAGTGKEAWVYVGDTGDNGSNRTNIVIYRFREPEVDVQTFNQSLTVPCESMTLTYPDSPHDAETLIATPDGRLLIVTKNLTGRSMLFITPEAFTPGKSQVLKKIGGYIFGAGGGLFSWLPRLTTGGDLSPDTRHLVVRTYADAYEWDLPEGKPIEDIWQTKPRISPLPASKQGESICYSSDGKLLYATSEKIPTPLFELTPQR